jgi:hypothetical protein
MDGNAHTGFRDSAKSSENRGRYEASQSCAPQNTPVRPGGRPQASEARVSDDRAGMSSACARRSRRRRVDRSRSR